MKIMKKKLKTFLGSVWNQNRNFFYKVDYYTDLEDQRLN